MQTNTISVCHIGLFDNSSDFWIGKLQDIPSKFPILESAHMHTFYSILLVEKATGEITIDNKKIDVNPGQVIILKPNCIHKIALNQSATGQILCFTKDFFSLRYNNNVLKEFWFLNPDSPCFVSLPEPQISLIENLFKQINLEFKNQEKNYNKVLRSYLNIVLIQIQRSHTPLKSKVRINPTKEKVEHYQSLIELHFKTYKKPSDYAQMLHISTNYLNKICKNTLGVTSGSLIQDHIMLQAQRLLNFTRYSINEIADELGYEHTSYFVTIFKKYMNQTPEGYRKTNSNK